MKKEKQKKPLEFSKKILIVLSLATTIIVVLSFVLMFMTQDLSPLSYIITGIFAELASATGFYYWKAKAENVIKIQGNVEDIDEEAMG